VSDAEPSRVERLDQYVVSQLPERSRAFVAKLIEQGKVLVNGVAQLKPGYKLRASDKVKVNYSQADALVIPDITLPVLYEDKQCVVINKPAGLLTHSKGVFNPEATVASWLSSRLQPEIVGDRGGIVHRLDRATSGVMICAKTPEALTYLQKQFSQRRTKKTYLAIVSGQFKQSEAMIDMPIERNPKRPQTFKVGSNGKSAQTLYKVLQVTDKYSLVELRPTTGRTHQLRVHMAQLGCPILGDTLYGGAPAERLYLHATTLELTLPNKQRQTFEVPMPGEFEQVLQ
jgi:23S rRNA pseudouridine1911/1915/1917 synthase